ncbi:hypothetical protein BIY24_05050 [Halobacteriovorax marinus]|uniref:DUF6488 family protein n=1 Tax=Halobacteriovorax marinus TaxID=97084 RepID=UPI000BC2EB28|nr:DUF6488 family protein [Halobacteriovorax marinus]ATH07325.1 hypothetical protein BIY24_05050 [Halobacteriovorax marinus]
MKNIFLIIMVCFSFSVLAGPGHDHGHSHSHSKNEVSKERTGEIGRQHIQRLVKKGKLDSSWLKSTFNKSEKKVFGKNTEWVVTFNNKNGLKGKTLFIFLRLNGDFIAANFTGK